MFYELTHKLSQQPPKLATQISSHPNQQPSQSAAILALMKIAPSKNTFSKLLAHKKTFSKLFSQKLHYLSCSPKNTLSKLLSKKRHPQNC